MAYNTHTTYKTLAKSIRGFSGNLIRPDIDRQVPPEQVFFLYIYVGNRYKLAFSHKTFTQACPVLDINVGDDLL